jgi:uncharacterized protein YjbI with pentapeptide repeats
MSLRRALGFVAGPVVAAVLLSAGPGCESQDEKDARAERARSAGQLARLLRTRQCVDCQIDARLVGGDLQGITLDGTVLRGDLQRANLRGARIIDSSLGGNLTGADLREASVHKVSFNVYDGQLAGARLDGLDLRTTRFADSTDWSGASLVGANLEGLSFVGAGGRHKRGEPHHLLDVRSGGAFMRGTDLRQANLQGAGLSMVDLREADLRGADLRGASMPEAADLAGAKLEGAIAPNGEVCGDGSVGVCKTKRGHQPPWRER